MRLVVDGVVYQLARSGIGRVWTSLLGRLAQADIEIILLDRGDAPAIPGIERVEFPSYTMTYTAADSLLLQAFCDRLGADVFTSTYYTTPTRTPQVQVIYDMIPEVLGSDLSVRIWKEKALAISYASHIACISASTRADLLERYPLTDPSRVMVMHCGVEAEVFSGAASQHLPALCRTYGLARPYYLLVGSREQHAGYKNGKLVFDAARIDKAADYDIVCVGGEDVIPPAWTLGLPPAVQVHRLTLSDQALATAYAGAIALVYPSLYEGFGLPVVEAMACGCPVITTGRGSLPEVTGTAATIVTGLDARELLQAMRHVRLPAVQNAALGAGRSQARLFSWDRAAEQFLELLLLAQSDAADPLSQDFHRRWTHLRAIQANVDVGVD